MLPKGALLRAFTRVCAKKQCKATLLTVSFISCWRATFSFHLFTRATTGLLAHAPPGNHPTLNVEDFRGNSVTMSDPNARGQLGRTALYEVTRRAVVVPLKID
jgi:hypothetical protein